MKPAYDVVAVGNAIVDVLATAPESFLHRFDITKGAMTLIDEERADALTLALGDATLAAGGSAANTVTGVVSFGGTAAFIGKVSDDALGAQYLEAFRQAGVVCTTPSRQGPPGTARSIIVITPDGERSMNTYLGASTLLSPSDVDGGVIAQGAITFLEGYLFDKDEAKAAFVLAAEHARAAERRVALTLSDIFCVERHRASFKHLVAGHVDVLFANEGEILALYETEDLENAIAQAEAACAIVAVTRSENGSIICAEGGRVVVAAERVDAVVDTTGAGDLYAAGFLFGLARGLSMDVCGRLGSVAAAEVISHVGPRPETRLSLLAPKL